MDLLLNDLITLFRPRELKDPIEWAFDNCVLRDNISELPGSLRIFPYAKEPLNSLINPHVNKVTLCWGSQSSKTTTMYTGVAYLLSEFPKDTLWIMPSAENARNFSKGRWLPFVEDCKPLKAQCPISAASGRIDSDKITNMRQEFLGCTLTFAGAGSENNVKSAPVAYLVLDEIDEIETDIRLAALERIKGRKEYKIIQTSTPKDEWGGIWEEYLFGDQRHYFMPCPHCNEQIEFTWRQKFGDETRYSIGFDPKSEQEDGKFDLQRVSRSAHYRCNKCDGKIFDAHKHEMIKKGIWIPQNDKAAPGHRSYHLSSLYAPAMSFGALMVAWLQAKDSIHGLKKFIQGNLAEPWRDDFANQEQNESNLLEQDYQRGEMKGEYRLLSVDTQTDHFRYIIRGFDRDGTSYLIDFGMVPSFSELDILFQKFACSKAIIDCAGDRTQEIYDQVFKRRSIWFGSRGWKNMAEPYRLQQKDPYTGDTKGRAGKGKFLYLHIDKTVWESEIGQLRGRQMPGFHTFENTPKEYYDQLFAIYWAKETDKHGRIKVVKKQKKNKQDHYFDCECMARALSKYLGLGRVDIAATQPKDEEPKKRSAPKSRRPASSFWD